MIPTPLMAELRRGILADQAVEEGGTESRGRKAKGGGDEKTRWILLLATVSTAAIEPTPVRAMPQMAQTVTDHVAWVGEVLKRLQTIKPGTRRADLLQVFTTEGGIYTRTQRIYVSRECVPISRLS
jgi:hypothetical protein